MDSTSLLPGVPDVRAVQYLVLLSGVLPYFIAVIQQRHWSSAVRSRVTVAVCALVAGGVLFGEGQMSASNWLTSATLLFALTSTIYARFAVTNGAASVESVTSSILRTFSGASAPGANPPQPDAEPEEETPVSDAPSAAAAAPAKAVPRDAP